MHDTTLKWAFGTMKKILVIKQPSLWLAKGGVINDNDHIVMTTSFFINAVP